MLSPQIGCVVGIDVAKQFQVVCALEAPSGIVRHRARRIEATSEGYTQLEQWLQAWGKPEALLIGLEATGTLWEPLYDWLIQAGYQVLVLKPRQTSSWAASLGLRAKTDGIDAHAPFAWPVGRLCTGQHPALGGGPILAHPHPCAPRSGAEPDGCPPTLARRVGPALPRTGRPLAPPRRPG